MIVRTVFGYTAWTDSALAVSGKSAPLPTVPVTVTRVGATLTASWAAAAGATGYDVNISGDLGQSWTRAHTYTSGTTADVTGIDVTKSYLVVVRSVNSAGSSPWTVSTLSTPSASPPPTPTEVTVTRSGTTLSVAWSAVPGAAGYNINTSSDYKATWTRAADAERTTGTSKDITIDSARDYIVAVQAVNVNGNSAWRNSELVRATPVPGAPASVAIARRTGPNGHTIIDVSWPAAAGAVTYEVKCGYSYYYMTKCAEDVTGTGTTITAIGSRTLTTVRDYYVAVRAVNSAGRGPWTGTNSRPPILAAISDVTATRSTGGTVTLTWTVPYHNSKATIAVYDIACSTDNALTWTACPGSPYLPANGTTGDTYTTTLTGFFNDTQAYTITIRPRATTITANWKNVTVPVNSS